jgi:hypothetical protein
MTPEERSKLLSKHRFMIQSRTITELEYNEIINLPVRGRVEGFLKLWDSALNIEKKNKKLSVDFNLNDDNACKLTSSDVNKQSISPELSWSLSSELFNSCSDTHTSQVALDPKIVTLDLSRNSAPNMVNSYCSNLADIYMQSLLHDNPRRMY